ncbi:membrane protein [Methylothermus subterraneus]
MAEKTRRSSWWVFGAIVAVGGLPLAIAWYLVNHPGLVGKPGNHGALIVPPRQFAYERLQPVSGLSSRPLQEIRGRWVIVHWIPKTCTQACQETLAATQKLHLLLNKDIPRVRRLAIWVDDAPPETEALKFLEQDGDLYLAQVSLEFLHNLMPENRRQGDQVWLVDPLGNLMMWYDQKFDPYGLYRDLRRLLHASRLG